MGAVLSSRRRWRERTFLPLALASIAVAWGLLLARLPLTSAALWTGLALLALVTLAEPLAGLVGGLFLGLLRAYLQAEVPQVPAQIGHLFVALAAAVWVAYGLARRDLRLPLPESMQDAVPLLPLLAFFGAAWLSLWNAIGLAAYGLPELVKWAEILLVYVIVVDRARARHVPWLLGALLLVGAFQAGVGLYEFGLRGDGPEHFMIPGSDFYRAYGTFEQPNPYAGYVGMTLALATGAALGLIWPTGRKPRFSLAHLLYLLPAVVLLAAALGASWSRGAWIGFAAAALALAAALPRRARWGLLLVGLLVLLGLGAFIAGLLPASVVGRLTDFAAGLRLEDVRGAPINDANYAVIERLAHWQAALEMWRTHFWTGVGLGCYEPAYSAFALINWPIALGHAHNIYLNLLAETGLIGTIAYLFLWGAVLWWTWRVTGRTSGLFRGVAIGLLGVWTQLTVHNFFDNLYVNNVHLFIGLCLGLLSIVGRQRAGSGVKRVVNDRQDAEFRSDKS
ncbi:MAG: O-antigen ligase family protein [Anaerolineae bacterium]